MHESDGVAEALHETLAAAMSAAAALARARAQTREDDMRQAQGQSEQRERELRARLDTERASARVELATVNQSEWWERASPEAIEHAWGTAVQWRDTDPEAARAAVRIRSEVEQRYDIDPDQLPATATAVPATEAGTELQHAQQLVTLSHAEPVAAAAAHGPSTPPRARRARGHSKPSVQREQGR